MSLVDTWPDFALFDLSSGLSAGPDAGQTTPKRCYMSSQTGSTASSPSPGLNTLRKLIKLLPVDSQGHCLPSAILECTDVTGP